MEFDTASSGCGLTVSAACFAHAAAAKGLRCALVDLDFRGGGLDLTLGLESEKGLRWSQIEAPLGQIDADALYDEMVRWNSVRVLAADPWNRGTPAWWEVVAVLDALSQCCDVVVVDAGVVGILRCLCDGGFSAGGDSVECDSIDGDGTVLGGGMTWGTDGGMALGRELNDAAPPPAPPGSLTAGGAGRWLDDPQLSDTQLDGARTARVTQQSRGPDRRNWGVTPLQSALGDAQRDEGWLAGYAPDGGEPMRVVTVRLIELSVLGLVRAKCARSQARQLRSCCMDGAYDGLSQALVGDHEEWFLGVHPAAVGTSRGVMDIAEAEEYLDEEILGLVPRSRRLRSDVLNGLGIANVPARIERLCSSLVDVMQGGA